MSDNEQCLAFPSLEWFEALRQEVNAHSALSEFGPFYLTLGIRVADRGFIVNFADERCASVEETGLTRLAESDLWIDQSAEEWKAMLENIKLNGRAEGEHTLNSLDLKRPDGLVQSSDIYRKDLFYRFNQSLQDFFDSSHSLHTVFRETPEA